MKDVVWLHVGMHKTGTTAIQSGLKFYDDGVTRYPRLGRSNHSYALSVLFSPRHRMRRLRQSPKIERLFAPTYHYLVRRRLRAELSGPSSRLIFSGETLSNFDHQSMTALAQCFRAYALQVKVLLYVRDPVSYASSAFQQMAKNGNHSLQMQVPSFRKQLKTIFEVFGKESVEVAAYDRSAFGAGGVVADAARRLGVFPDISDTVFLNEGLSTGAVGLLYFWNRTGAPMGRTRRFALASRRMFEEVARALPGKFRLAPSLVQPMVDPRDLDWLMHQTGIDFRSCLTLPDAADSDVYGEEDLRAAQMAAMPALMGHMDVLGIKNVPWDPNEALNRLVAHFESKISYLAPYLQILTRSED